MNTKFNTPGDCRVRFFQGGCVMQRIKESADEDHARIVEITIVNDTRLDGCKERSITSLEYSVERHLIEGYYHPMTLGHFLEVEGLWDDAVHDMLRATPKPAQ